MMTSNDHTTEKVVALVYYGRYPHEPKKHAYIEVPLTLDAGATEIDVKAVKAQVLSKGAEHYKNAATAGDVGVWGKPLFNGRPGMVYAFMGVYEEGRLKSVYKNTGVFITVLYAKRGTEFEKLVAEWQLRNDSIDTTLRQERLIKKAGSRNVWREALRPLREEYLRTGVSNRAAFVALVIQYITTGMGDKK